MGMTAVATTLDITTDLLCESINARKKLLFMKFNSFDISSADHPYPSPLAHQDQPLSKACFGHHSVSLNRDDNHCSYTHIGTSYRTYGFGHGLGDFLDPDGSLRGTHDGVFFGVSFLLCRARVTCTRGSKSPEILVYGQERSIEVSVEAEANSS